MSKIRKEQFLDPLPTDLNINAQTKGDILYFNGTNWVKLAAGTDGYVLTTHSAGQNPTWTLASGGTSGLSSSNPINIDNNAASPGVGSLASRSDHKHAVNVAAAISIGATNAQGTATTLALSDHTHAVIDLNIAGQTQGDIIYFNGSNWVRLAASTDGYFLTTHSTGPNWTGGTLLTSSLPADVDKSGAAAGVSGFAARSDHKHNISTATAVSTGASNSQGTATSLARSDHTHAIVDLSISGQIQGDIIYFNGTNWVRLPAATTDGYFLTSHLAGSNPTWTAGSSLTSTVPTTTDKSSALVGVSGFAARSDHKHDISTAITVSIGATNAEGVATSIARSDHTHAVTDLKITSQTQGDILYFNGTNWVRLPAGSDGYALITHGAGQNPTWDSNFKAQTINLTGGLEFYNTGNIFVAPDSTSVSAIGKSLNINGQSMSAANSLGGGIVLQSGTGSFANGLNASDGYMVVKRGNTTLINFLDGYSDYIQLGATPGLLGAVGSPAASVGHIRLPNNTTIRFRNVLNNADITALKVSNLNTTILNGTNIAFGIDAANYQSMAGGLFISESTVIPSANPNLGSFLYVDPTSHHPVIRTQDGYVTDLATSITLTNSLPADVDKSSALVGVSGFAARADHKHSILTAPAISSGSANTEGTANTLARSDHTHATNALSITSQTQGDILYFNGTSWVRLPASTDGYFLTTHTSSSNPTWTVGSPLTSFLPADIDKSAALVGVSGFAARSDHKHSILTSAAISVGATNAEGTATTLARSDHTHAVTNLSITSQAQGDLLYYNGANWTRLAASSDGYVLTTHNVGNNPTWNSVNPIITNDSTTAKTLAITDQNAIINFTSGSAITVTVPTNASVPFAVGSAVIFIQGGAGQFTLVPSGGVTLNSSGSLISSKQYASISITKLDTNVWLVAGERA